MNVTIIGSFRKYYDEICTVIEMFEQNEIRVLSPKISRIVENLDGFVILKSDNSDNPQEIQQRVFDNIDLSDYVYVWNPDGYVGVTTAYEIGRIAEKGIDIYYKEKVKDLPIYVPDEKILAPEQFIYFINSQKVYMMA
jgi:hypothetical protein